jgi:hypothetical protein
VVAAELPERAERREGGRVRPVASVAAKEERGSRDERDARTVLERHARMVPQRTAPDRSSVVLSRRR